MSDRDPIPTDAPSPATRVTRPVVINRGRQRRNEIAQLKRGQGELWAELTDTVRQVVAQLGGEADGKIVIPVAVIYRTRARRQRIGLAWPFGV
jgi:hypothetical protein